MIKYGKSYIHSRTFTIRCILNTCTQETKKTSISAENEICGKIPYGYSCLALFAMDPYTLFTLAI